MRKFIGLLVLLLPVSGLVASDFVYEEFLPMQTNPTTTWVEAVVTTVAPATTSDWFFWVTGDFRFNCVGSGRYADILVEFDGVRVARYEVTPKVRPNWYTFGTAFIKQGLEGPGYSVRILFRRGGPTGINCDVRNLKIMAFKIGEHHFTEDTSHTGTTSTSYVIKAERTFTPTAPGYYLFFASARLGSDHTTVAAYANLVVSGVQTDEVRIIPFRASNRYPVVFMKVDTLDATPQTVSIQYKTAGGSTARLGEVRVGAIRLTDVFTFKYSEQ